MLLTIEQKWTWSLYFVILKWQFSWWLWLINVWRWLLINWCIEEVNRNCISDFNWSLFLLWFISKYNILYRFVFLNHPAMCGSWNNLIILKNECLIQIFPLLFISESRSSTCLSWSSRLSSLLYRFNLFLDNNFFYWLLLNVMRQFITLNLWLSLWHNLSFSTL